MSAGYQMVTRGSVVSVMGFPIKKTERAEELTVSILEGDYSAGRGIIVTLPKEATQFRLGTEIHYEGGDTHSRPKFKGRVVGARNHADYAQLHLASDIKARILANFGSRKKPHNSRGRLLGRVS